MKAFQRSYKFLPEAFQTNTNRRFLATTMDQLVTPSASRQLNYYIGRKFAIGSKPTDSYYADSTNLRNSYQLEVGAAVKQADGTYTFGATMEDFINSLKFYGIDTANLQQILSDDFRPADFKIDLDKLVNYGQYYWLPSGPSTVQIDFSQANQLYTKLSKFVTNRPSYFDSDYFYVGGSNAAANAADTFPNVNNARTESINPVSFKIPLAPQILNVNEQVVVPPASMVGVAVNGQPFYTYTMGSNELLNDQTFTINTVFLENHTPTFNSSVQTTTTGFDRSEDLLHNSITNFCGHPDINGVIHYHAFNALLNDSTSGHSKILGFAFDGFPIYGPRAFQNIDGTGNAVRMTSSYHLKSATNSYTPDGRYVEDYEYVPGLGTLDANNGRFGVTPEFPNGTYAYFMTVDFTGVPVFPYVMGPSWTGNPLQQSGTILPPTTSLQFDNSPVIDIERDIVGKQRFSYGNVTLINGLKIKFDDTVIPTSYRNIEFYVEGVGSSIQLVPVNELEPNLLETPKNYLEFADTYESTNYDVDFYDGTNYQTLDPHYITIIRSSQDRNAWSRSNRWFHYSVIEATAKYLNEITVTNHLEKAARPIIEFNSNLALYNHERKNIAVTDLLDFGQVDALSNVQGQSSYYVDGVALQHGMNIVFAADQDSTVSNKVYRADIIPLALGPSIDYNITLPPPGSPALPGPFAWTPTTSRAFSIAGDFRSKQVQIEQDGIFLRANVDFKTTAVYNPTAVLAIKLTNSGNGYVTEPTVTINGAGKNAVAKAILSGDKVVAVVIINPGTGYNRSTTVTISSPPTGKNATAVIGQVGLEQRLSVTLFAGSNASSTIKVIGTTYQGTISLVEVASATTHDGIWVRQGKTQKGKGYYYNINRWVPSQAKTLINQAPMFDLVDENQVSVGDRSVYFGSTFTGSTLFSYKKGTGTNDVVLGFPLSYKAIGLVGDIEFEWNHSTDNFQFTFNKTTSTLSCESFYTLNTQNLSLGAITAINTGLKTLPVLDLRYIDVATNTIDLKVRVKDSGLQETILVQLNDQPLYRGKDFDLISRIENVKDNVLNTVKQDFDNIRLYFRNPLQVNDKILITMWTDDDVTNTDLTWKVPLCVSVNPSNDKISLVTFSQMQNHLVSGAQLVRTLTGQSVGANNLFTEPSVAGLCSKFGYNNGNSLLAMALLKNRQLGFVESVQFAKDEYTKFKNLLIQNFDTFTFDENNPIPSMLDTAIESYTLGKTDTFPFYNSDMLPGYTNFVENAYAVGYSLDKSFPISAVYSNDETSRQAVVVYYNGKILTRFKDYDFSTMIPSLRLSPDFKISKGDMIVVREYETTEGNWVATTPAKLGLAASYQPGIITIKVPKNGILSDALVIRGHDGSLTPIFSDSVKYESTGQLSDQRDLLLLEFENRIFGNIKKKDPKLADQIINQFNPLPGYYRSSSKEFDNAINSLDKFFGQWISKGRLDYNTNSTYLATSNWTWNYKGQQDVYGNTVGVGNWWGIYQQYFDTVYPNLTPWEMLGFAASPDWWESEYGPAPYTNQNFKLWNDIEQGVIRQGNRAGIDERYARTVPNSTVTLQSIIPVDQHGNLLSPPDSGLVIVLDTRTLDQDWIFGDMGPVEQAWRRSSEFVYACQLYTALTTPRFYFGTAFDLLDAKIDPISGLLLKISNTAITEIGSPIRTSDLTTSVGNTEATGYFSWIQARARALSIDPNEFTNFVTGIVPRLMYRMTGYTDKDKLQVYINAVSPGSTNALSLLPDNNYQLLLDQSSPTSTITYSGVTVTRVANGWRVEGYDPDKTYFYILPSTHGDNASSIRVGGTPASYLIWDIAQNYIQGQYVKYQSNFFQVTTSHISGATFEPSYFTPVSSLPITGGVTATLWENYDTTPSRVFYGVVYRTAQEVFDFLIGYGRYLDKQGFLFDQFDSTLGETKNWVLSAKEFLYWSYQNWNPGSVIALSPASQVVQIYVPQGELDALYGAYADPQTILNQNGDVLRATDIAVDRNFDVVTVAAQSNTNTIFLLKAVVSDFDHLAIFDDFTDFNDVVYDPTTGTRQQRLKIKGSKSNSWNGKLFAPGFTLDQAQVSSWSPYTEYNVGDLVRYSNIVYVASINHKSSSLFNYTEWNRLIEQPRKHLQPNLDTLADRIEKFYDLNDEQISSDVSNYARHLIGYQARDYLKELLVNDETQFKFYQGMITQKGTEAAIYNLERGSNPGGIPSVDVKNDWALRVGELGLSGNTNEVEVALNGENLWQSTVMLDLTGGASYQNDIVSITGTMLLDTGNRPANSIFPTTVGNFKQQYAGYARLDHVDATVLATSLLPTLNTDVATKNNKIIWSAKNTAENSAIYRTKLYGPYTITIVAGNILSLNGNIAVESGDGVWLNVINYDDYNLIGLRGYQTVAAVMGNNEFTLTGQTSLLTGSKMFAYISRFEPVEFADLIVNSTNVLANVLGGNPVQVVFAAAHGYNNRQKIFLDSVAAPFVALGGKYYYVKVVNDITVKLYNDYWFTQPCNFGGVGSGSVLGVAYSDDEFLTTKMYESTEGQRVWIDNYTENKSAGWAVLKKQTAWKNQFAISPSPAFSTNITKFGEVVYSWQCGPTIWFAATATLNASVSNETDRLVFVFERTNSELNLQQSSFLRGKRSDGFNHDCDFGAAITTLDNNTLVVGCPNTNRNGIKQGAVQLYIRDFISGWIPLTLAVGAPVGIDKANFGSSLLRVDDDLVLVGAPASTAPNSANAGAIYKLERQKGRFIGYIAGNTLTVVSVERGAVYIGATLSGNGIGTAVISGFVSGLEGAAGVYTINGAPQTVGSAQFPALISAAGDTFAVTEARRGGNGYAASMSIKDNLVAISDPYNNGVELTLLSHVVADAEVYRSGSGYATGDIVRFSTGFSTPAELQLTVTNGAISRITILNPGVKLTALDSGVVYPDTTTGLGSGAGFILSYGYGDLVTMVKTLPATVKTSITANTPIAVTKNSNLVHVAYSALSVPGGLVKIFEVEVDSLTYTPKTDVKQILTPPNHISDYATDSSFGVSLAFSDSGTLLVGHPTAPMVIPTTFDNAVTTFDGGESNFEDLLLRYGAIHSYGWYDSSKFVWDHSIPNPSPKSLSPDADLAAGFGYRLAQTNNTVFGTTLFAQKNSADTGIVHQYNNLGAGWFLEAKQEPVIDVELINRSLSYDAEQDQVVDFLSFWDPIKNVHDSDAMTNIDYIAVIDPAVYQSYKPGNNYWGKERVGATWWDNSQSSWLWYEQGELDYRKKYWGSLFPGGYVLVYEWVESDVVPSLYNVQNSSPELGQPLSLQYYNTVVTSDVTGATVYKYYFWVYNKTTIASTSNKTLSVEAITSALVTGPNKWVAAAGANAILTKNLNEDLTDNKVVLQVEVLNEAPTSPMHVEWALISEGNEEVPPSNLVSKMIDSLAGSDIAGNPVPDINLPDHKKLGIKIRPKQTMFQDRVAAIENSTEYLNDQLNNMIVADVYLGSMLSVDPTPLQSNVTQETYDDALTTFDNGAINFISTYTNWNAQVNTYSDIIQEYVAAEPAGYRILVLNDENHDNVWTTYEWTGTELTLKSVQKYDTTRYWSRADYYSADYPKGSRPDLTLATEQEFLNGNYTGKKVKVLGPGYWRVLTKDENSDTNILAMQNGTVKINLTAADFTNGINFDTGSFDTNTFDPMPSIELRNILTGLRDNVFLGQYAYLWNSWFFRMVRYAFSEQKQLDWAFKSSFIRVKNTIAELAARPIYSLDVQDSLEKYINEVKPYHTKIRDYTAAYTKQDQFNGLTTDFDCPPVQDKTTTHTVNIDDSAQANFFKDTWPWRSYRDNRSYGVVAIVVTNGGTGYTSAPSVVFVGGDKVTENISRAPTAKAYLSSTSQNFNSLNNKYFTFRKVWQDRQVEKGADLNADDLLVQNYPNEKYLLASAANTSKQSVRKITIGDTGQGYLTPPDVSIVGGGGTGATAYAILGDTSARMFRTGIKFDRVSSRSNILYKEIKKAGSYNPGFDEWHAAERVAAYYTPGEGMPGIPERITKSYVGDGVTTVYDLPVETRYLENVQVAVDKSLFDTGLYTIHEMDKTLEFNTAPANGAEIDLVINPPLSTLMRGADFDYTKIVGPNFSVGAGLDSQDLGFDGVPFDAWDLDPNGGFAPYGGVDTYQQSGVFASAGGYDPSQALVSDGAALLSPETIPSTEELLNGQVFDTLSFTCFSGVGLNQTIHLKSFIADGSSRSIPLAGFYTPTSVDNVTVFINGLAKKTAAYTIDYQNNQIVFAVTPLANSIITVTITEDQGPTVEQVQTFVASGSTDTFFIYKVGPSDPLRDSIVTVDGVKVPYSFVNSGDDLVFTLTAVPPADSIVRIVVYLHQTDVNDVTVKSYAESHMQTISLTGSSTYTLDHLPGVPAPTSASTVVYVTDGVNLPYARVGQRLTPPDTNYYIAAGMQVDFKLPDCPGFDKSVLTANNIQVSINGALLTSGYSLNLTFDKITLAYPPKAGVLVTVTVLISGDYYVINDQLHINSSVYQTNTKLLVNTFNDTALTNMRTEVFSSTSAFALVYGGFGIYGYGVAPLDVASIALKTGKITLSFAISNANQANVFKNGRFLLPGQDWSFDPNSRAVINISGGLLASDIVVVHYFAGAESRFCTSFRIFKDMLGNINYYRLTNDYSTRLSRDILPTDDMIYVDNGTNLLAPTATKPGVVMIGAERIEYRTLSTSYANNNFISQLRRGTKGTVPLAHGVGDFVIDLTERSLIPQSDVIQVTKILTDGVESIYPLPATVNTQQSVQVFLGGRRVSSGYVIAGDIAGQYARVVFDKTPKAGILLKIVTKQSSTWYNLATPDLSLQDATSIWADFIKAKAAPLLFEFPPPPTTTPGPTGPPRLIGPQGPLV